MKYKSTPVASEQMKMRRIQQVAKAITALIDASVELTPEMHDKKLRDIVEAAYRRATYIQGVLATELN